MSFDTAPLNGLMQFDCRYQTAKNCYFKLVCKERKSNKYAFILYKRATHLPEFGRANGLEARSTMSLSMRTAYSIQSCRSEGIDRHRATWASSEVHVWVDMANESLMSLTLKSLHIQEHPHTQDIVWSKLVIISGLQQCASTRCRALQI